MRCRGLLRVANPHMLGGFLCSGLLRVAPYCVPSGVRVVSITCSRPLLERHAPQTVLKMVSILLSEAP
jgi:hypothetical protein